MAAVSRLASALIIVAVSTVGFAAAEDICEGCWEVGGRGGVLLPGQDTGLNPSAGFGGFGSFHFRPFWAVEFGLDRHPGSVKDGPDETVTLLMIRGAFTFRSSRDQRTRPFMTGGLGLAFDQIGTSERTITTPAGRVSARSNADSSTGVAYEISAGALTWLRGRLWLRYEGQWVTWSTFGIDQEGFRILGSLTWRMGR